MTTSETFPRPALSISCDGCVMHASAHCAECIVTHVLSPARREQEAWSTDDVRAVNLLANAGMMPTLMHREAE